MSTYHTGYDRSVFSHNPSFPYDIFFVGWLFVFVRWAKDLFPHSKIGTFKNIIYTTVHYSSTSYMYIYSTLRTVTDYIF